MGAGRFHGRMAFQDTIEPREVEHSEQERAILDVLVDLPARYRIEPDRFDYGYLAERRAAGTTANFQLLVKDLIERAPHVVQTRGLRGLTSQARKATRYMGVQQYEREMAWSLWRHAGPGTRLDLAGPYRAHGAAGPRLRAPLARAAAEPAPDSTGQAQPAPPDPRAGALAPVRDDAGELRAAQRIADAGITVGYSLVVGFVIAFWTGSGVPILRAPPLALGVHHLRRRWRRARRRRDLVHSSEDRGPIANDDAFAPGAGRDHT